MRLVSARGVAAGANGTSGQLTAGADWDIEGGDVDEAPANRSINEEPVNGNKQAHCRTAADEQLDWKTPAELKEMNKLVFLSQKDSENRQKIQIISIVGNLLKKVFCCIENKDLLLRAAEIVNRS